MLLTLIREVADEPLIIDPAARDAEWRENTWGLSTSVDERASLSTQDVVSAFEECASILRERFRSLGHTGSATFYVWHDTQAGGLKCSTTSLPRDQLPFGARIEPAPLAEIVDEFLGDVSPGQISWDDLAEVSDEEIDEAEPEEFTVRVWTTDVGVAQ